MRALDRRLAALEAAVPRPRLEPETEVERYLAEVNDNILEAIEDALAGRTLTELTDDELDAVETAIGLALAAEGQA